MLGPLDLELKLKVLETFILLANRACLSALAAPVLAWGVPQASLLVDPLLAPHSEAFSGALFQCHLVQGDTGATAVVAAGGRCDEGWQLYC